MLDRKRNNTKSIQTFDIVDIMQKSRKRVEQQRKKEWKNTHKHIVVNGEAHLFDNKQFSGIVLISGER